MTYCALCQVPDKRPFREQLLTGTAIVELTAPRTHVARILIADSDDDTRMLYRETLRPLNCDIVDTSDGPQALVSALSHPPTIVITETALFLIDGYSLCELLRRDAATRNVPILVVTGEGRPSEIARARRMGADAVLVKPCLPEVLMAEVLRLCDPAGRRRRDALNSVEATGAKAHRKRSHERYATTTPPAAPPQCRCPVCDADLRYERSHIGGVNRDHAEQWDDFVCTRCASTFLYRHRTRKLRQVS
jgi:CheY-like chemotaxis protein